MSRPQRVSLKSLPLFDKLHTRVVKMFSGTKITCLHLIKETRLYYISIESWAFCCTKFKAKKQKTTLVNNLPIVSNTKTCQFLEEHSSNNLVDRYLSENNSNMIDSIDLLNRLYPNKKKKYFIELSNLVSSFCNGDFISYDDNGVICDITDYTELDYFNYKYIGRHIDYPDDIVKKYDQYKAMIENKVSDVDQTNAYNEYRSLTDKYIRKNNSLLETFINIGEHIIVVPYIFNKPTMDNVTYTNAGEIFMIVTNDTVYFEYKRHH